MSSLPLQLKRAIFLGTGLGIPKAEMSKKIGNSHVFFTLPAKKG